MSRRRVTDPVDRAGAFLSDGRSPIAVPIRTLSDDYSDLPAEPEEDREPEPEAPGKVHRLVDRLARRSHSTH